MENLMPTAASCPRLKPHPPRLHWTILLVLAIGLPLAAQSPEAATYAERPILLLDPNPGTNLESVMPMLFTAGGSQQLEFIPSSKIKESMQKGGQPIRLGDVLSALNNATQRINQLQSENDKLWKVATRSDAAVVVQQAPPSRSQEEIAAQEASTRRNLALQLFLGTNRTQPYSLPMPVNPNGNRVQANCTTYRLGDITHTNCN